MKGEMDGKFFPAQSRHGRNQIGKAFFTAETAHSQNPVGRQTGGRTINVLNEGQRIVNEVDFAFASGRAEFFQPFHVGSVIGADKQRIAGLLREQPVLGINITGPASERKGDPGEPGSHPGCRRGSVCPRCVKEADAVIRDEFGEPETGKETERVFRVRFGISHALQQYFPDQAQDKARAFPHLPEEGCEDGQGSPETDVREGAAVFQHLGRLSFRTCAVERVYRKGKALFPEPHNLTENERFRSEREPEENVGQTASVSVFC